MALALTAYEDTICPGCGLPASHVLGDANVGRYEAEETICHGCEVRESARDSIKDPYPGMKLVLRES